MRLLALSISAAVLAGCSSLGDMAGAKRPGFQANGTYVLSDQEQQLSCEQLQARSTAVTQQIQEVSTKAVNSMQWEPSSMASPLGRLFGFPGAEAPEVADYKQLQAESTALDDQRRLKGCMPAKTAEVKPKKRHSPRF